LSKLQKYLLTLFFLILLAVPGYWLLKGKTSSETSVVEARQLVALGPTGAPNLKRSIELIQKGALWEGVRGLIDLYVNASFVSKFETAASDQFPLRMPIIEFSKALERKIISLPYAFVSDPVFPADMVTGIYFDSENNQLLQPVTRFNDSAQEIIDERIDNYNALIQAHPEQNFYLYYHQTLHNSQYHPMAPFFPDADNGQGIRYFEDNLPEGLVLKKFMLSGMQDHLDYYYRVDHHWNVNGIFRAYDEIYEMLAENYPDITEKLNYQKIIEFPDINFLGYMARKTFYPVKGDVFKVELVDFPPHDMLWSDQIVKNDPRKAYFDGEYATIPYTNHFNAFYGNVTDLIEYTYENDSDRNLLIIGSSFRNALDPLLASHYHKTYCIDLRYFRNFSLSDFLANHKVDDILIVGDNVVAFHDIAYWKIGE
jgi:hypothetical protein